MRFRRTATALIVGVSVVVGLVGQPGASASSVEGWDAIAPKLRSAPGYEWVNPTEAFVMNGELVWTEVRFTLGGQPGVEASELARGLGLHFPSPDYREHYPAGVKPADYGLVSTGAGRCRFIWNQSCRNPQASQVDKVWFHSGNLGRMVVVTWNDTYWNGQRRGDGYYRWDGRRFIRFDEVVPAFGGTTRRDDRGLVWIEMPPRIGMEAGEACVLHRQTAACDVSVFLFPEAISSRKDADTFWLLGYQADTGGQDRAYSRLIRGWNHQGLKYNGRKPTAVDLLNEAVETAAIIIMTTHLFEAGANASMLRFFPSEAGRVSQALAEHELRVAMAMADKAPPELVARAAQKLVGQPVLPETAAFRPPPGRGFYYVVRTMRNPAPAEFQRKAALSDIRPIPGYPGKYVMREFGTGKGGRWVDNYICQYLCDAKGNYDWMLKDGEINPSFAKQGGPIMDMVDELADHARRAEAFGDRGVRWLFEGPRFRSAFERYLIRYHPRLGEQIGSRIFFIELPGYSVNP